MTDSADATSPAGEMDTNYIPHEPGHPDPALAWTMEDIPTYKFKNPSKIKEILLPAILCTLIGAAVTYGAIHYTTPTPQHPQTAPTQNQQFLDRLEANGIETLGYEGTGYVYLSYAPQICYGFAPPHPETLEHITETVQAVQLDVAKNANYPMPIFNQADTVVIVEAALDIYCPQLRPTT